MQCLFRDSSLYIRGEFWSLDELNYSWSPSGAIIETLPRLITENAQASGWFITLAIHLSRIDTHARAIRRATHRHAILFLFHRQCFRRINASDYVTGAITTPWYVRTVIIFWSSSLWLSSSTVGVDYHGLFRVVASLLSFLQRYCENINGKLILNEKKRRDFSWLYVSYDALVNNCINYSFFQWSCFSSLSIIKIWNNDYIIKMLPIIFISPKLPSNIST